MVRNKNYLYVIIFSLFLLLFPMRVFAVEDVLLEVANPYEELRDGAIQLDIYEVDSKTVNELKQHTEATQVAATLKSKNIHSLTNLLFTTNESEFVYVSANKNYVILQAESILSENKQETGLSPIILTPKDLNEPYLRVEGKLITLRPDIYFFKVDDTPLQQTLEGAQFILYEEDEQGVKQYFSFENSPNFGLKSKASIFYSDKKGLVRIPTSDLPIGDYVVEEVVPPKGYELTKESKHIQVTLALDSTYQVSVNQQKLNKFVADDLSRDIKEKKEPSIINRKKKESLKENKGKLPQTNEQKTIIALMGAMLLSLSLIVYINKKRGLEDE